MLQRSEKFILCGVQLPSDLVKSPLNHEVTKKRFVHLNFFMSSREPDFHKTLNNLFWNI